MKKTKRSEKEIDIRPFIYKMELQGDKIFMMLASASAKLHKPELVTDTFFSWLGIRTSGICLIPSNVWKYTQIKEQRKNINL
mgnify:CR=1 FL=1